MVQSESRVVSSPLKGNVIMSMTSLSFRTLELEAAKKVTNSDMCTTTLFMPTKRCFHCMCRLYSRDKEDKARQQFRRGEAESACFLGIMPTVGCIDTNSIECYLRTLENICFAKPRKELSERRQVHGLVAWLLHPWWIAT